MKDNLAEAKRFSELLDFYGRFLTPAQQQIMSDYYLCDLSLSEISENRTVSRSAVLDSIKTASKKLLSYEEKLGLAKLFEETKNKASKTQLQIIEELEGKIKNGI
ncbi:MAG: sigma factor-like helix-turn-helix DNA-binding protein [Bacilli bacterium]|jgi:hypothetical protein